MSAIQREFAPKGVAVVGGTIDPTGLAGLQDYVTRFDPEFAIGAMDEKNTAVFGQWGPRRLLVPQLFLIDKNGIVQGQFMGSDTLFDGDKVGNLRAAVNHMIGLGGASKQGAPAANKNPLAAKKK